MRGSVNQSADRARPSSRGHLTMLRNIIADREDFEADILDHLQNDGVIESDSSVGGAAPNAGWLERQHPLAQALQRRFRSMEKC